MGKNTTIGLLTELEQDTAESEKRNRDFLMGLDPQKTALFCGLTHDKIWKVQKRRAERRYIRRNLHRLLEHGFDTIFAEGTTLFGYYTLDELARQKEKHPFTLVLINRRFHRDWVHVQNPKLHKVRFSRSIHMMHSVDYYIGEISRHDWFWLMNRKIGLTFIENSKIIRSRFLLTQEQYCQWGPPPACTLEEYLTGLLQESDDA